MQVSDAEAFNHFIAEDPENRIQLLQRRIAPRNHDAFCEEHDYEGLPGIHYDKIHAVTFYRSTKTKAK